jgi:3-deoxy-D-arabino-heptulosonate 7-phosphate (DAHP) synthase
MNETAEVLETADKLKDVATHFRIKLWGGGTLPERYIPGVGRAGLSILNKIQKDIMPCGIEVQDEEQIKGALNFSFVWVGARNSQNYSLLRNVAYFPGEIFIKRGAGMTVKETIGIFDIMKKINNRDVYIIERGVVTADRQDDSRWSPDLKGIIQIKHERPDIFNRMVVDCSHSVGRKEYVKDTYRAFRSIGVNHYMFECMAHPEFAKTDTGHMISVDELKDILC